MAFAAVVYWYDGRPHVVLAALAGITIGAFLFYLFRYRDMDSVAGRVAHLLTGVLYVALLLTFVALLKKRGSDGGDVDLHHAHLHLVLATPAPTSPGASSGRRGRRSCTSR